jgi:L,D-transpeptidase catalytic domain
MSLVVRLALAACALFALPAQAAVLITVDKSSQQMTVAVDGRPLYQWPVSTGRAGYDTPGGKFRAFRMERDHFSKEFDDAPMPFSIFFTEKGHAIHGSYDKRIGQPASHGCVRLSPANAETLYALVEQEGVLNTTVVLTGTIPSAAPAVARRRTLPRPDELESAQPQYAPRQAQQYYYQAPAGYYYAQPFGSTYAQPYGTYYAAPRGYIYRDPYGEPAYRSRGSLFD